MRQLGLSLVIRVQKAAVAVSVSSLFVTVSCTRAVNQESVPPSSSAAGGNLAAPTATASRTEGSSTGNAKPDTKVYDDSTRAIEAKVGDRFAINLPANITTPYKWVVASTQAAVVLAERHYEDKPPAGCTACVGYPGTDRFTFEAKQEGITTLVLQYAPLRSKSDPAERELSIQVTVSKQ
jgi:predicted secreted protein